MVELLRTLSAMLQDQGDFCNFFKVILHRFHTFQGLRLFLFVFFGQNLNLFKSCEQSTVDLFCIICFLLLQVARLFYHCQCSLALFRYSLYFHYCFKICFDASKRLICFFCVILRILHQTPSFFGQLNILNGLTVVNRKSKLFIFLSQPL